MNKDNYKKAQEIYASYGIDTEKALARLAEVTLSIQCWQLDDVKGFESPDVLLSGGIAVTGTHPGLPETPKAYMKDVEKVLAYVPGKKRLNLHAIYHFAPKGIERNQLEPEYFEPWIEFAKANQIGLDFNPTCFSHPLSSSGFTLSHTNPGIRKFWIEHIKQTRKISAYFGKALNQRTIHNIWIPDGYKDLPIDTLAPRIRLKESLDEIFEEEMDSRYHVDALESKLFGIGTEAYTTGSHEFYTNYVAMTQKAIICLDAGHFHPTETISSKLSAYLAFQEELLLHVSRPMRWDSDHVVILDDETERIMREIVRMNALKRVHIAMDFFDGSIDRVAATIIGARATLKALLKALLEPVEQLKQYEKDEDYTSRLAWSEEIKTLPFGDVFEAFCERHGVIGRDWVKGLKK
jgi:L-rhamnose isomerase